MSTTRIDLGREYFAGMAAPSADQAGYTPTVDAVGTNFEYRRLAQVTTAASNTWDGSSVAVHVKGSGARSIALPDPTTPVEGWVVTVVDALGNAAAGNITIDPAGSGTVNGATTLVLNANYASARLQWVSAGAWVRV